MMQRNKYFIMYITVFYNVPIHTRLMVKHDTRDEYYKTEIFSTFPRN